MTTSQIEAPIDGRKQRTNDSRQKIVEAMLAFIREGNVAPSAEQVASKAGVGLRTVFRRFNEMELLFRELSIEIQRNFKPELARPLDGNTWQEKLFDLIKRKNLIYNIILPYRIASIYHQHESDFIRENINNWNKKEENMLAALLPFSKKDNASLFYALNTTISFPYWMSLRKDQGLSAEQCLEIMNFATAELIKDL